MGDPIESSLNEHLRSSDRHHYAGVLLADTLSMLGSFTLILMVPRVVVHVPSQKKRMLLILFTAISNLGFSTSNIAAGQERNATSRIFSFPWFLPD